MSIEPQPTVRDHSDQPGEALDAERLPDEFPEQPLAARAHGITAAEQASGESLDRKLMRENRGDGSEFTDGTAGPATRAVPSDESASGDDSPHIVGDLDQRGRDLRKDLIADADMAGGADIAPDSGRPHVPRSAESAALREVDADDVPGAVDRQPLRD